MNNQSEINFEKNRKKAGVEKNKAAAYVRMSTDNQEFSIENQMNAISLYAEKNNFEIVKTYSDEGKSGLKIDWREGFKEMIDDVQSKKFHFNYLLVLDNSRFGRFQDADEGGYHAFNLKQSGIKIHYVRESHLNDESMVGDITRVVTRIADAKFIKDLSEKVFAGQCNLIVKGFRQGGHAGYGLRRRVLEQSGAIRTILDKSGEVKDYVDKGERKFLQSDRVILIPGPEDEVKIVNWIYESFATETLTEGEIADDLNNRGILTDLQRKWTIGVIRQILTNEKYIGNNVFNRKSFKLKNKRVKNPPQEWIRFDGAFEPVISKELFFQAQVIITERSKKFTNEEMLEKLKSLYDQHKYLSGIIIDEAEGIPSSTCYSNRFGGLLKAYSLIGYTPETDYKFIEINRYLRTVHANIFADVIAKIESLNGSVELNGENDLLTINNELTASIVITRCFEYKPDNFRWKVRLDSGLNPDFTIVVRMDHNNQNIMDYYILPSLDIQTPQIKLHEYNHSLFEIYNFQNLDEFFVLTERCKIPEAA